MQGAWNGTVIAESDDDAVVVERNHYVPADAIKSKHFEPSSTTTVEDAARYRPENKDASRTSRAVSPSGGRRGPLERS
jgi:uncharacterized protein (DUF427 family)